MLRYQKFNDAYQPTIPEFPGLYQKNKLRISRTPDVGSKITDFDQPSIELSGEVRYSANNAVESLKGEGHAKINNIFCINTLFGMSLTEKKLEIFYRFHSLRKRASFQHSYMASTTETNILL